MYIVHILCMLVYTVDGVCSVDSAVLVAVDGTAKHSQRVHLILV